MRKRAFLVLVLIVGLLSLLWLASSQSTALASSSTGGYTLTISSWPVVDGIVDIDPEDPGKILSIDCRVRGSYCSITFSEPQNVTLEVEPDTGYTFAGWGGDCSSCGTTPECTIRVDSPKTCSVTFTAIDGGGDRGSGGSSGSGSGSGGSGGGSDSGSGSGGSGSGTGSGSGSSGGSGGTGGGGGGCSMTGSASSMAGLWNILLWLSVPLFALARRIRKK
jgi:uncharacterized repeat protein (TIGR02543 family)